MKMKIINIIKKSLQAMILELISIVVTIIFITSLAGTWFGIIVFGAIGVAYETQKIWMILEVKRCIRKKNIWGSIWRSGYLTFLIIIALLASLSYSLSTIEQQTIKRIEAHSTAVPSTILDKKTELEGHLYQIELEAEAVFRKISVIDLEIDLKLNQIEALPAGWITASERLSKAVSVLEFKKQPCTIMHLELMAKRHEIQSVLNKVLLQEQEALLVVESKFGAIASEEFMRVAEMLSIDSELFLKTFMLAILMGVEFGIILLLHPEEALKLKVPVIKGDPVIPEMDKMIDAMLSHGQGKLLGVGKISELSGISIPRVSAYRAAFIQHGFIKCSQGASSSLYSRRDLKEKARKIRDRIDL